MKNKLIWLVLGFIVLMMFIPASFVSAAPKGKIVYVTNSTDFYMDGLDWFSGRGYVSNSIKALISDSLVVKDLEGKAVPGLAESWEVSNGGLTIKFKLVKNAKFHDGSPVTAEDIKFSLERYTNPKLKWSFGSEWQKAFKNAVVEDDYTVTVNFNEPYPAFFDRCTEYFGITSKKYVEKIGDENFKDKPLGGGPFKPVKFDYGISIDATAVDGHYRKTPFIKDFSLLFVSEDATRMAMLKTGEADIIYLKGNQIPELKNDPNLRMSMGKYCFLESLNFFDFNNDPKGLKGKTPWHDIRVRKAMDYAIDRKLICERVLNGAFTPYRGIIAPYHAGFDPAMEKPTKYDPEKAKALLKEAGVTGRISAEFTGLISRKTQMEAVAGFLAAVGVDCKVTILENATSRKKWWARENEGLGEGTGAWWVGRNHVGVALKSFMTSDSKYGYAASPKVTELVHKSMNPMSEQELAKIGREINETYLKEVWQLSLWATSYPIGIGPKVAEAPHVPGWGSPSGFEFYKLK